MIGIYIITNKINGKSYIGKAEDSIEKRLNEHYTNRKSSIILQRAINKYGIDNFEFKVLEECSKDLCSEREKYWISFYRGNSPGVYNIACGGNGGNTVSHLSEDRYNEYLKKIRKPRSEKFRKEQSARFSGSNNPMYGKHISEATHKRLSEMRKGSGNSCYGKKLVNNGIINKYVPKDELDSYLNNGWVIGYKKSPRYSSATTIESITSN